ncbi:hypothetical protein LHK12_06625 [Providencia rettgeri]|nr:hypothetical protein [Providencia rettgeri]
MDICHLVAPDITLEDAPKEALRMLNWLKHQGIIDPDFQSIEYGEVIYRPTPTHKEPILYVINDEIVPTQLPEDTLKNYLSIVTERTVFHAGGNGLGIYCPQCANEQSEQSHAWVMRYPTGMKENQKISLVFIAIFMAHLINGNLTLNGHSAI